jgi:hypothetical protein
VFDLGKLVPKLPDFAIAYWDRFLGICFVLVGLAALLQKVPHAIGLLLSGFGLTTFGMARRCWHYIGGVRVGEFSPKYKRTLAYPKVLASVVWVAASWSFFRYAALDFEITAQWIRRILHY